MGCSVSGRTVARVGAVDRYRGCAQVALQPEGLESYTVAVDDASRTERAGAGAHRVGLSLTDAERRALGGVRQMGSRVGSIGLSVPGYR